MLIWAMEKVGIATNVVRIAPERQQAKLIGATPAQPAETAAAA
jgi:hypothetical protein